MCRPYYYQRAGIVTAFVGEPGYGRTHEGRTPSRISVKRQLSNELGGRCLRLMVARGKLEERVVAETELLSSDVVDLGRGLGTQIQRKSGKSITLGRDCRVSSPRLRDALIEGLIDSGCQVTDIGVVPIPIVLRRDRRQRQFRRRGRWYPGCDVAPD